MTRILSLAALTIVFAPSALACGMYMPMDDEPLLADVLDEIDAIEIDADVVAELIVQEAVETEDGDALADADAEADVEVEVEVERKKTRREKRQERKARR